MIVRVELRIPITGCGGVVPPPIITGPCARTRAGAVARSKERRRVFIACSLNCVTSLYLGTQQWCESSIYNSNDSVRVILVPPNLLVWRGTELRFGSWKVNSFDTPLEGPVTLRGKNRRSGRLNGRIDCFLDKGFMALPCLCQCLAVKRCGQASDAFRFHEL